MELLRNLLPASSGAGTWVLLIGCSVVFLGVAVSVLLPWLTQRRNRRRIERGDYDY